MGRVLILSMSRSRQPEPPAAALSREPRLIHPFHGWRRAAQAARCIATTLRRTSLLSRRRRPGHQHRDVRRRRLLTRDVRFESRVFPWLRQRPHLGLAAGRNLARQEADKPLVERKAQPSDAAAGNVGKPKASTSLPGPGRAARGTSTIRAKAR
jgi:hypothetical protein